MQKSSQDVPLPARLRCAIYTRKSTEEGLEQEFNSLDAQREAAEAFILSQRREGWIALPDLYDDGGFTGANMDRPALTRLLGAVEAGELDCVVVYKVDRLSRSLLDFTRMLGVFEKHKVSFVAVTQQFNTSTSLGRLTLNILLSFAQFERELIGERTRDKMSAARRKGKWVGGCPVLGYDVDPGRGRLVVNEEEAKRVRAIFALFEKHGSVLPTLAEIERREWRLKSWTRKAGQFRAGGPFALNSLRRLLTNILYTGAIRHKGLAYPGEHAAILKPGTWERVQSLIAQPAAVARGKSRNKHLALLSGLLYCESCATRMVYSYLREGRPEVSVLCLPERPAQRLGGVSGQVTPRAGHRGISSGTDPGIAAGTDRSC
jgi:site-specific DNA recombinase